MSQENWIKTMEENNVRHMFTQVDSLFFIKNVMRCALRGFSCGIDFKHTTVCSNPISSKFSLTKVLTNYKYFCENVMHRTQHFN